jgi:DNA-binding CsgD family transcriptional regulator
VASGPDRARYARRARTRARTSAAVTPTEMAVLQLVARGLTYKEVAAARGVAPKTVDHQMQSLFRKFGVHSRGELVAHVLARGIVALRGLTA